MKRLLTLTSLLIFGFIAIAQQVPPPAEKSLFERLGGKEGVSQIVDETIASHMINPLLQARFLPYKGTEKLEIAKDHLKAFFAAGSGGPNEYKGRSMVETHTGMNISPAEYVAAIEDTMKVLDKNNIDEESKKDVLFIFWSLRTMIIGQ